MLLSFGIVPLHKMPANKVLSVLKYVSRMKKEFMLSELKDYVEDEMSIQAIYNEVSSSLFDLRLNAIPMGNDFRIMRAPGKETLVLSPEDKELMSSFLKFGTIPKKLQRLIEQYIGEKTSKDWDDPIVLEKIRWAIQSQKAGYWKEGKARKISYEKGYSILGYLAYQFPVYFIQFQHILYGMELDGLLKTRMKIVDFGTGPGTVPAAIADHYMRLGNAEVDIHSVELYDENLEAYKHIVPEYAKDNLNVKVEETIKANIKDLTADDLPDKVDMMVFSNVLNEISELSLDEKAALLKELSKKLVDDGNIVLIEPADKANSTELRRLMFALKGSGLNVYSPCSFIWCAGCKPDECWSFEQKNDINPPVLMKKLADCEEPFRYLNTDIKYSYVILRKDRQTRIKFKVPLKAKFARLATIDKFADKRINIVCSVMSGDLGDNKYSVYKVCDGTSRKQVYVILPFHNMNVENNAIKEADYGGIIKIYDVLVKYNEEKDSYNLILGKMSAVEKVE